LHHERIKNADLLQCFHVAMNAGECCVKTVEEIVDLRFGYTAGIRHTAKIRGSHGSPFS
jgi:ferritin-like protein